MTRRHCEEFLVHATEKAGHADGLARRIAQLGGDPDFSPDSLSSAPRRCITHPHPHH